MPQVAARARAARAQPMRAARDRSFTRYSSSAGSYFKEIFSVSDIKATMRRTIMARTLSTARRNFPSLEGARVLSMSSPVMIGSMVSPVEVPAEPVAQGLDPLLPVDDGEDVPALGEAVGPLGPRAVHAIAQHEGGDRKSHQEWADEVDPLRGGPHGPALVLGAQVAGAVGEHPGDLVGTPDRGLEVETLDRRGGLEGHRGLLLGAVPVSPAHPQWAAGGTPGAPSSPRRSPALAPRGARAPRAPGRRPRRARPGG